MLVIDSVGQALGGGRRGRGARPEARTQAKPRNHKRNKFARERASSFIGANQRQQVGGEFRPSPWLIVRGVCARDGLILGQVKVGSKIQLEGREYDSPPLRRDVPVSS